MDEPLVSVIIVNYNGLTLLEACLKSLMKTNYKNFEVFLVDNNSSDDSVKFVKENYPQVQLILLDENLGFAQPNNIAAKKARGEFLTFLNSDTEVTPSWISELVKVANQDSEIAICQSLLLKPNGDIDSSGDFIDTLGRAYSSRTKTTEVKKILSARGASLMVRRDCFWRLGGFDENFFASFEDVDLGWRAWICGYKVVLAPRSVVIHKGGETIQKLSSKIRFHGVKNTLLLRLVNFEIYFAINSIIKLFFVTLMRKSFGISVIKDPEPAPPLPSYTTVFRGIIWILKNLKYVSKRRNQINSRRVRTTKDLMKMGLITKI